MPILLLLLPVISTLTGGLLALRFRQSLILLIALGTGLLLGAAFLDLLPEAILLGAASGVNTANVLGLALLSFLVFFGLAQGIESFAARFENSVRPRQLRGRIGASMLIFHSFRDGMAIGLSYAASHPAGYAVAAGIIAHDLGDGMNTIVLATGGELATRADYLFLAADSLAPLLGGLLTVWWAFSAKSSVFLLAVAAGFFIQMATNDFLPELQRYKGPRKYLLPTVFLGAAIIYFANLAAGHLH